MTHAQANNTSIHQQGLTDEEVARYRKGGMSEQVILFAHAMRMKLNAAKASKGTERTVKPNEPSEVSGENSKPQTMTEDLAEELPQLTPEEIEEILQES